MRPISIELITVALAVALLGGCTTNKEKLLTHGDNTMLDIWQQQTGSSASGGQAARQQLDARQALRRPIGSGDINAVFTENIAYTRTAANEIHRQFHRLPNPDLLMYVFPHLSGSETVPIPGYTTVFPLYQRVPYALPGERLDDY